MVVTRGKQREPALKALDRRGCQDFTINLHKYPKKMLGHDSLPKTIFVS
jgi:predicted Rossmann fold nucleotide-binding protein DprA/Smf involved in DNA uptake